MKANNSLIPFPLPLTLIVVLIALIALGCQSMTYRALGAFGIEKRQILSSRVEGARDAQDDAREQFASALEQFRATVAVDGGELENTYRRLNREFERSQARADEVARRINAVEHVAEALFKEWEGELELYSDQNLKRRSRVILEDTRERYGRMLAAMHQAEQSMAPVLSVFQDQVLFLRHNLNSMAISAIRDEMVDIERATEALIEAMNTAISEANRFIATLDS